MTRTIALNPDRLKISRHHERIEISYVDDLTGDTMVTHLTDIKAQRMALEVMRLTQPTSTLWRVRHAIMRWKTRVPACDMGLLRYLVCCIGHGGASYRAGFWPSHRHLNHLTSYKRVEVARAP